MFAQGSMPAYSRTNHKQGKQTLNHGANTHLDKQMHNTNTQTKIHISTRTQKKVSSIENVPENKPRGNPDWVWSILLHFGVIWGSNSLPHSVNLKETKELLGKTLNDNVLFMEMMLSVFNLIHLSVYKPTVWCVSHPYIRLSPTYSLLPQTMHNPYMHILISYYFSTRD